MKIIRIGAKSPALCRSAERRTDEQAKRSHLGGMECEHITKPTPFGGSGCAGRTKADLNTADISPTVGRCNVPNRSMMRFDKGGLLL
jgi:hypothetical protein